MERRARRRLGEPRLDLLPDPHEELDVGAELRLPLALAHGADDEPAAGRAEAPDELAQAVALVRVVDPPGDAEVAHLGHVDEIAARQADEGRDPGPLGAERFLGDLDEDLLALAEDVLDRRDHAPLALGRRLRALPGLLAGRGVLAGELEVIGLVLGEHHPLVLAEVGDEVAGVEEGVLGQADVDERGLHARQDVGDDALIDVPDDGAMSTALDEELGEDAAVEDGDAGLADSGIDDDLACHRWGAPATTPGPSGPARLLGRSPAHARWTDGVHRSRRWQNGSVED